MSSVPKLGNNRYLATSKGVNRMLNQLNGILADDNITVQNVTATGGTATTTISLASGNFIKVTIAALSTTTLAFTDNSPGLYYLLLTNSATAATTAPVLNGTIKVGSPTAFPVTGGSVSIATMICDGTNIYELTRSVSIS